eukprot:91348-Rhodomonas_salina.1
MGFRRTASAPTDFSPGSHVISYPPMVTSRMLLWSRLVSSHGHFSYAATVSYAAMVTSRIIPWSRHVCCYGHVSCAAVLWPRLVCCSRATRVLCCLLYTSPSPRDRG